MIKVYHLVDNSRFRDSKQILFLLYLPIGLLLICFRIVVLLILCINCLLLRYSSASQYLNSKLVRIAFGIAIETENLPSTDRTVQVFVGNSVSHFDVFVINQLTGSQALVRQNVATKNVKNWMKNMKRSLGYCLDCNEKSTSDHLETHLLSSAQKPLFIQPEVMITNGKSILKFENESLPDTLFREGCKSLGTQPVVLQVYRRWFDIAIVTVQSTLVNNLFWYLISPQTCYTVRFLEPRSLNNATDLQELRDRMLKALNVDDCQLSAADVQQYLVTSETRSHRSASFFSTEYLKRELQGMTTTAKKHSTTSDDVCKKTAFSNKPKERMQSLEERKKEMIEQARRRYLAQAESQKHDLQTDTTS